MISEEIGKGQEIKKKRHTVVRVRVLVVRGALVGSGGIGILGAGGGATTGPGSAGREEVAAIAASLASSVLVGILGGARALGTSGDAAGGVVGLGVAGAGDLVAGGHAADLLLVAWRRCY